MIYQNTRGTTNRLIAMLTIAALLSACGGEEKKKEREPTCLDSFQIFLGCILTGDSGQSTASDNSLTTLGFAAAPIGQSLDEYEPNDVPDNANVVTIPGSPAKAGPLAINGEIKKGTDSADVFVFTPPQSGTYRVQICAASCEQAATTDLVYIMIYDQSQTTLASTPIGIAGPQSLSAELNAGFAYYIEINGYNTGDDLFGYSLVVENL